MKRKKALKKTSWLLIPILATTLACGIALTAIGFYVCVEYFKSKLYLGLTLPCGFLVITTAGLGIAAVTHRFSGISETLAYVSSAAFSSLALIGLYFALVEASNTYPTYKTGVIGGAVSTLCAMCLGSNLVGFFMCCQVLCCLKRRNLSKNTTTKMTTVSDKVSGLYTDV